MARAAARLRTWLTGRTVVAARSQRAAVPPSALVGQTVGSVESNGKHLLIRFESGRTLHTHFRMTGSWHVYRAGQRWRRPAHLARVVLDFEDRVAVCFDTPVVELLDPRTEATHGALTRLGPDVMADEFDGEEAVRRLRALEPSKTIGEALLDQRAVAGIGNIFRSEALFRVHLDPRTTMAALSDEEVGAAVDAARNLMRGPSDVRTRPWVYGRRGRACRRCRTRIESASLGSPPRTAYWCPKCQIAAG